MIGRPPKSTLFPYPTLSRSGHRFERDACSLGAGAIELDELRKIGAGGVAHCQARRDGPADVGPALGRPPLEVGQIDRKSTRLNSSHQIISYAVFCLKKKQNI